jgi:hypothetical protein
LIALKHEEREITMSKQEALHQALAACGAAIIAFIGVCHMFVGETLFPWGPAFFGGPIGWYGIGIVAIVGGLLVLGGTLRLFPFPVITISLVTAVIGLAVAVAAEVLHGQFHMFALAVFCSGILTAYFHRKASRNT